MSRPERGHLARLATVAAAREGVVKRTFGTSTLYDHWTSEVIERASDWKEPDYRAYCEGAIQATKAIHQAISGAASEAVDPDLEGFLSDYVKVGVSYRTREAIAELLHGVCDILLEPVPGMAWTEVDGVAVSRHSPEFVNVTGLVGPEIRVASGRSAGDVVEPLAGLLIIGPKRIKPMQAFPIVVETVESGNELSRLLGTAGFDVPLVHFGYDMVHVFGASPTADAEHMVRGLQMGADVPAHEARAVIEAQERLFVQRRHGIFPQETIANVVEQARVAVSDLVGAGRDGAEAVFAGLTTDEPVPAPLAVAAARDIEAAFGDELRILGGSGGGGGTIGGSSGESSGGSDGNAGDGLGHSEQRDPRTLAVDVRGELSDSSGEIVVLVKLAIPGATDFEYVSDVFDVEVPSPVTIEVAVRGFEVLGTSTAEMKIEGGAESPTYAFMLSVLPTNEHRVLVYALQQGRVLAQVRIDSFPDSRRVIVPVPFGPRADVRVRIDAQGAVTFWEGTSDKAYSCSAKLGLTSDSRGRLDSFAKDFDAKTRDWSDKRLDREIHEIGELAKRALPDEIVRALSTRPGLSVYIQHPEALDFPFELALLSIDGMEVFVGEVHAITRWIEVCDGRGIQADDRAIRIAALATVPRVREMASTPYEDLKTYLDERCEVKEYTTMDQVDSDVLLTNRFQLLDVLTHVCTSQFGAGLELEGGELRPTSFREPHKAFCAGAALVFLNACSSAGDLPGVFGDQCYPERLLEDGVGAVVASTLPVNVKVAVGMAHHFYEALAAGNGLGAALLDARVKTIADEKIETRLGTRRLTALGYCAFGHPDMKIHFERDATVLKEAS